MTLGLESLLVCKDSVHAFAKLTRGRGIMRPDLAAMDWVERVRAGYAAFNAGDGSVIADLTAPDCVFRDYGAGQINTTVGAAGLMAQSAQFAAIAAFTMEVVDVHPHLDVGLIVTIVRVEFGTGVVFHEAHLVRLVDDQVVEYQSIPFDVEASKIPFASN